MAITYVCILTIIISFFGFLDELQRVIRCLQDADVDTSARLNLQDTMQVKRRARAPHAMLPRLTSS